MAAPMEVSIVSAEKKVWEGEAELVIARSPEGEFGIMNGHIPFLAALVPGRLTIHRSGGENLGYVVTGGFLEASGSRDNYHVIVLADDAREVGLGERLYIAEGPLVYGVMIPSQQLSGLDLDGGNLIG